MVPSALNRYVSIKVTGPKGFFLTFIVSICKPCKFKLPLYFYTNIVPYLISIPANVNS